MAELAGLSAADLAARANDEPENTAITDEMVRRLSSGKTWMNSHRTATKVAVEQPQRQSAKAGAEQGTQQLQRHQSTTDAESTEKKVWEDSLTERSREFIGLTVATIEHTVEDLARKAAERAAEIDKRLVSEYREAELEHLSLRSWIDSLQAVDEHTGQPDLLHQADAAAEVATLAARSEYNRTVMLEKTFKSGARADLPLEIMVQPTAIDLLIALLSSKLHGPTSSAKHHAASALGSLCQGGRPGRAVDPTDVKDEILRAGGVDALCACLEQYHGVQQAPLEQQLLWRESAAALAAIAAEADYLRVAIAKAGALRPLVDMLGGCAALPCASSSRCLARPRAHTPCPHVDARVTVPMPPRCPRHPAVLPPCPLATVPSPPVLSRPLSPPGCCSRWVRAQRRTPGSRLLPHALWRAWPSCLSCAGGPGADRTYPRMRTLSTPSTEHLPRATPPRWTSLTWLAR